MCFIVDEKQSGFKIANKDIVCYKESFEISLRAVDKQLFTPLFRFGFTYRINVPTKKVRLCKTKESLVTGIRRGYHSYKLKKYATPLIGKFIIPKGTKYYENETEYVSETLIFKGYIK